ncbi:hypothetical protein PCE1_002822 [Barthelona sp. PCE]
MTLQPTVFLCSSINTSGTLPTVFELSEKARFFTSGVVKVITEPTLIQIFISTLLKEQIPSVFVIFDAAFLHTLKFPEESAKSCVVIIAESLYGNLGTYIQQRFENFIAIPDFPSDICFSSTLTTSVNLLRLQNTSFMDKKSGSLSSLISDNLPTQSHLASAIIRNNHIVYCSKSFSKYYDMTEKLTVEQIRFRKFLLSSRIAGSFAYTIDQIIANGENVCDLLTYFHASPDDSSTENLLVIMHIVTLPSQNYVLPSSCETPMSPSHSSMQSSPKINVSGGTQPNRNNTSDLYNDIDQINNSQHCYGLIIQDLSKTQLYQNFRRTEKQLSLMKRLNGGMIWTYDIEHDRYKMSGSRSYEELDSLKYIDSDERNRLDVFKQNVLIGGSSVEETEVTFICNDKRKKMKLIAQRVTDNIVVGGCLEIIDRHAQSMASLHRNANFYKDLFDSSTSAIFLTRNHYIETLNEEARRLFRARKSLKSHYYLDVCCEFQLQGSDTHPTRMKILRELDKSSDTTMCVYWLYRRMDKSIFIGELTVSRITLLKDLYLHIVVRDVTDQYILAATGNPTHDAKVGVFIYNYDTEFVEFTNNSMERGFKSCSYPEFTHELIDQSREEIERIFFGSPKTNKYVCNLTTNDGKFLKLSVKVIVSCSSPDKRIVLGTIQDVTSTIYEKRRFVLTEQRLRSALRLGKMGCWVLDLDSDLINGNDEFLTMCGIALPMLSTIPETESATSSTLEPHISLDDFVAMIDVADRDKFFGAIENARMSMTSVGVEFKFNERFFIGYLEPVRHGRDEFSSTNSSPVFTGGQIWGVLQDITELRKVELELQRRHAELEMATSAGSLGYFVKYLDKNMQTLSKPFCDMMEYDIHELDVIDDCWWKHNIHPEDKSRIKDLYEGQIRGEAEILESIFRVFTRSKKLISVHQVSRIVEKDDDNKPLIIAGFRRMFNIDKEIYQAKFDKLFHFAPFATAVCNEEGHILLQNTRWINSLGGDFLNNLAPSDRQRFLHSLTAGIRGEPVWYSVPAQPSEEDEDRKTLTLEITVSDVHSQFSDKEYLIIAQDITDRLRFHDHLKQAQKIETAGQFAGSLAHDFGNTLQVILGYSEQLINEVGNEFHKSMLQSMTEAAMRSKRLVSQLMTLSRRQDSMPECVNLPELMTNMFSMLQKAVGETVSISMTVEDRCWGADIATCMVDLSQIQQLFVNIAVNARDAMHGQGELFVRMDYVSIPEDCVGRPAGVSMNRSFDYFRWVLNAKKGTYFHIEFRDTGCGIPEALLKKVFEPFFTTKPVGKGTGLGLVAVFSVISHHKGGLGIESKKDEGTAFHIFLPVVSCEPPYEDIVTESLENAALEFSLTEDLPATPIQKKEYTIMLVEDDKLVRRQTMISLRRLGHTVIPACDGPTACNVYRDRHMELDLIILDVIMPGMNGREVYDHCRKIRPLPVLFCSGYSQDLLQSDYMITLPNAKILRKPYLSANLITAIDELMRQSSLLPSMVNTPIDSRTMGSEDDGSLLNIPFGNSHSVSVGHSPDFLNKSPALPPFASFDNNTSQSYGSFSPPE